MSLGLVLFTIGLTKKVLIADRLAEIADPLFTDAGERMLTFGEAWSATLAFTFQLFCDFSGYTEMAIGIALLFGLLLPENFRRPYLSTNLREFWRRWHISLSNFIRDYLYIPLGGSRAGPARTVVATMVAMGICGLWHGAGWTYVVWGLWHGAGLVVCRAWQRRKRPMPRWPDGRPPRILRPARPRWPALWPIARAADSLIISFDGPISRDPDNFMDQEHYRMNIARLIEARIDAVLDPEIGAAGTKR